MELLFGLFVAGMVLLVLIVAPIVALIAFQRTTELRADLRRVGQEVERLRRTVRHLDDERVHESAATAAGRRSVVRPVASRAERTTAEPEREVAEPEPVGAESEPMAAHGGSPPAAPATEPVAAGAPGPTPEDSAAAAFEELVRRTSEEARDEGAAESEAARGEREAEPAGERETAAAGAGTSAIDFETRIGTTWLLRIGLGVLAIALALFARSIVPQLSAPAKVALAYAGAMTLFAVGRRFEERLDRFARPVMAAGLTFGFFVAFAAYFVPAMRAVPLGVSIAWMVFGMGTVLLAAERWQSQITAVLAVTLGHVSAFVSAGTADVYALVVIAGLAVVAVVLTLRRGWVGLGLFAVAATYGSHLLWLLAERAPISGDVAFWTNLAFLAAYYGVFVAGDAIWWRRDAERDPDDLSDAEARTARQIGPANLVLFASLASFAYVVTGAGLESIEWFYLTLGAAQGALAAYYFGVRHRDYVFYPAFGTVLWTLGLFAALDALALNLVLAAQAIFLLLAAHRTRLLVFHALAQAALAVAFLHYLVYPHPADPGIGFLLGGIGIAGVYVLKASLEEAWYGDAGDDPWGSRDDAPGWFERALDALLRPLLPYLAPAHAALGGFVVVRELLGWWGATTRGGLAVVAGHAVVAALVLARRGGAVLFAFTSIALAAVWMGVRDPGGDPVLLLAVGLLAVAAVLAEAADRLNRLERPGGPSPSTPGLALHALAVVAIVIVGLYPAAESAALTAGDYTLALATPLLALYLLERLRAGGLRVPERAEGDPIHPRVVLSVFLAIASAGLVFGLTARAFGTEAATLIRVASLAAFLGVVARWRRSEIAFAAAYALVIVGYAGLTSRGLDWSEALSVAWVGLLASVVPLALGLGVDREAAARDAASEQGPGVADALAYAMYAVAFATATTFSGALLPSGWSLVAVSVVAAVLLVASSATGTPRARPASVAWLFGMHLAAVPLFGTAERTSALLLPLLALCLATLAAERLVLRAGGGEREPMGWRRARDLLVVAAAWTAMAAIYDMPGAGTTWATAGWSAVGVTLMIAGFALRSATHRRVALAVLALCLVRVFVVDTQGLSDTERTVAFFVLGVSLVGAAWLYSRFSEELKSWL